MTTVEKAIEHYTYGITHDIFKEPVTSYAKLSIEALEKQIPQKVICDRYFYGYTHHCPSCKSQVEKEACGVNPKCCSSCGQALDWGE